MTPAGRAALGRAASRVVASTDAGGPTMHEIARAAACASSSVAVGIIAGESRAYVACREDADPFAVFDPERPAEPCDAPAAAVSWLEGGLAATLASGLTVPRARCATHHRQMLILRDRHSPTSRAVAVDLREIPPLPAAPAQPEPSTDA